MASAFEPGGEVGVEHLDGLVVGDEARREDDDIGIVVAADQRGDLGVPAKTCTDPLVLVERHGHPFARAAERDAAFHFALLDGLGQRVCEIRVIDAFGRVRTEVEHVVAHSVEITYQKFFHFVAGVIAGDTYFFHPISVCLCSVVQI